MRSDFVCCFRQHLTLGSFFRKICCRKYTCNVLEMKKGKGGEHGEGKEERNEKSGGKEEGERRVLPA
jgi:hypothetical protein